MGQNGSKKVGCDMNFGKRIARLRASKKLTQEQLAKKVGITRTALAKYENNTREPDFETMSKFADFFGVSIDYLVLGENPEKSQKIDLKQLLEERRTAHWDGVPLNEKQREAAYKFFSEVLTFLGDNDKI